MILFERFQKTNSGLKSQPRVEETKSEVEREGETSAGHPDPEQPEEDKAPGFGDRTKWKSGLCFSKGR